MRAQGKASGLSSDKDETLKVLNRPAQVWGAFQLDGRGAGFCGKRDGDVVLHLLKNYFSADGFRCGGSTEQSHRLGFGVQSMTVP